MPKLTETFVRKVQPTKSGTAKYWDSEVKGLVLFAGKQSKTWYFQKDVGGRTQRALIGRYPAVSADVARQTALTFALEWGRGAGKRLSSSIPTLEAAMEGYLARPRLRSDAHKHSLRLQFDRHLKHWMGLPLDEITKSMVADRHRALLDTPSAANHVLKYFRTVWNHARRVHDLPECPTIAVEWYEERPSGETIGDLEDWLGTIEALPNPIHKTFYELLLFTGLRRTEALSLEWKHVHDDHIHLPVTKNGRSFDLPILPIHHEILAPMRNLHRRWVFPSPKSEAGRVTNPQKITWSPHAHRRTFAIVAVEAGVLEEIVGRLLNHTPLSITGQRYAKPSLGALAPAMELVCDELKRRLSSAPN